MNSCPVNFNDECYCSKRLIASDRGVGSLHSFTFSIFEHNRHVLSNWQAEFMILGREGERKSPCVVGKDLLVDQGVLLKIRCQGDGMFLLVDNREEV